MNILLWFLLALIWGSSYAAIKLGIETIDPMPLVAGRMIIGSTIMFAILKFRGLSLSKNAGTWLTFLISGLMGSVVPFLLISYGENHVDSAFAAMLMGITPVATVLLAPFILADEKFTTSSIVGIIVGVAGLILLTGPGTLSQFGDHLTGQFSIIGAALCYAFTTIYVRRYATRPALEMATGSMLVGATVISVVTLVFGFPLSFAMPSAGSIAAIVYLGIFPTALATLIYFYLIPHLGASRMSQVNFAVPVFGALIGVLVLGETIKPSSTTALLVIMFAIYLVTSKNKTQ